MFNPNHNLFIVLRKLYVPITLRVSRVFDRLSCNSINIKYSIFIHSTIFFQSLQPNPLANRACEIWTCVWIYTFYFRSGLTFDVLKPPFKKKKKNWFQVHNFLACSSRPGMNTFCSRFFFYTHSWAILYSRGSVVSLRGNVLTVYTLYYFSPTFDKKKKKKISHFVL